MKNLVTFCGVGGTGKTVTMDALRKKRPDVVTLPSIVRGYYASRGVENEIEYHRTMKAADRFGFQIGLLEHYMASTREGVMTANGPVVMDRSVFDHIAYSLYADPDLSAYQLRHALSFGDAFLLMAPRVVYFPYPTEWTLQGSATEDGFRATGIGKNYMLNATMLHLLQKFLGSNFIAMPEVDIDTRAEMVAALIGE